MIRVLLADDQELVRAGFRLILELDGFDVVGEAADGAEGAAAAYGPAFGLDDVDDLAERTRGVGLPVTVLRQGAVREVPEDVGLTVYRVVQEALTNVLKHAGPASAVVSLSFSGDLDVLVTDDGRGAAAAGDDGELPGAGLGTSGMTERVAALGGTLTAGPRQGGGYQVHARIPLSGVSALGAP